jgi:hypothetical protein
VRRLALYTAAHLWLAPDGANAVAALERCFDAGAVAALMADEAPEISACAHFVMSNYVAFRGANAERLLAERPAVVAVAKRQLGRGTARVKAEAAHFLAIVIEGAPVAVATDVDEELVDGLRGALELDDAEVSEMATAALARIARIAPVLAPLVLDEELALWLDGHRECRGGDQLRLMLAEGAMRS